MSVGADLPGMSPAVVAAAWVSVLSRRSVTTDALEEFFAWRRDPINRAAFDALSVAIRHAQRFIARERGTAGEVIDIWTGEPAEAAKDIAERLSLDQAQRLASVLNASLTEFQSKLTSARIWSA